MPLFCIIGRDAPNSTEKRERLMEEHLTHLKKLNKEKRLFAAGPLFDGKTVESQSKPDTTRMLPLLIQLKQHLKKLNN